MAFAFPAYHTETYRAVIDRSVLRVAAKQTFAAISWPVREETYDKVIATRGVSLWSWGEIVSVQFGPDNSYSVTSKCIVPFQCCDWGRNRRNVQEFADALKEYL